MTQAGKK